MPKYTWHSAASPLTHFGRLFRSGLLRDHVMRIPTEPPGPFPSRVLVPWRGRDRGPAFVISSGEIPTSTGHVPTPLQLATEPTALEPRCTSRHSSPRFRKITEFQVKNVEHTHKGVESIKSSNRIQVDVVLTEQSRGSLVQLYEIPQTLILCSS